MDHDQLQQLKQFFQQYYYQILVGCFVLGIIFGSIPFFLGLRRGKRNLGIIALIVTIIDSVIWLPLGLITAIVFTVIILVQKTAPKEPDTSPDITE